MDNIHKILHEFPFFLHFKNEEIAFIRKIGNVQVIKKGEKIDLHQIDYFAIVLDGLFEIVNRNKNDIVYLSPGSFFGEIPLTTTKRRGIIKAVYDSRLIKFDVENVYKFFISNYKGYKGYIRTLNRIGFTITDAAECHIRNNARIITVYSPYNDSGKSIFSSLLGMSLSRYGDTIIIDSSYKGNSVFNIFEKEIAPAISQISEGQTEDQLFSDRILEINENLFMMNIAFGSNVKVNSDIISPILFLLTKKYKYIVIDLSDYDHDLRDKIFSLTDIIFTLIKKIRDKESLYDLFDSKLVDGQRVYYTLNRYYSKDAGTFEGGYIFENLKLNKDEALSSNLYKHIMDDSNELIQLITSPKRGLVIQTDMHRSVMYTPLFSAMDKTDLNIDILYSSFWGFFITTLFLLCEDIKEFEKNAVKFISEDRINNFLDITFPDKYLYRNSKIFKFAQELTGTNRIEIFKTLPLVMLSVHGNLNKKLFSTGFFKDILCASLLIYPVFESHNIAGELYNSGFPINRVRVSDLLRTDVDEIIYASIKNDKQTDFRDSNISNFYRRYIDYQYMINPIKDHLEISDKNIVIDIEDDKLNPEKISKLSDEIAEKYLT
ncbi:MAG: cyclic nucleotide-binding domain-containing protein [Spirochaetota bacterium]|nr:cyclic nucleotide-binding domain-containing protein [Spirochaetota bacterium]